ncbi:MAG: SHOCT domain-containing protein [Pseudomonadota bacterium]
MSIADEIAKLERLRAEGTLSDAEFDAAKNKLLQGAPERSENSTIAWGIWTLVVVVLVAAGAVLFMLNDLSEGVKLIAGTLGLGAAAAGGVLASLEDISVLGIIGFGVAGLGIAAVAFLGVAPIIVPIVLVVAALVALWTWFGGVIG